MNSQIEFTPEIFFDQRDLVDQAREIGDTVLQISKLVIDFASIKRRPRFCENYKENDAEHSFMLALASVEVCSQHFPGLDSGLAGQLALVHDTPELKTNDIATFDISDKDLKKKHENEAAILPGLLEELPPHIADLLCMYEEQKLPEAKLVSHLDKLQPNAVNISGAGMVVMKEYGVTSVAQYLEKNKRNEARFRTRFPEPHHDVLHLAHEYLANKFALYFDET